MTRDASKTPTKKPQPREEEIAELTRQQAEDGKTDEFDRVYAVEHHSEVIGRGCFRRLPSTRE